MSIGHLAAILGICFTVDKVPFTTPMSRSRKPKTGGSFPRKCNCGNRIPHSQAWEWQMWKSHGIRLRSGSSASNATSKPSEAGRGNVAVGRRVGHVRP